MPTKRLILLLIPVIILSSLYPLYAANKQYAVRTEYGTIDDKNYDQPFTTVAIFVGWCRNYDRAGQDVRDVLRLYRVDEKDKREVSVDWIGDLMINRIGQEVVCVDDLAMHPQAALDNMGEMLFLEGFKTSGEAYRLDMKDPLNQNIIILEKMEVLNHKP